MARIRTIKPSFFTSLTIADIPEPWTRLFFPGLWTHCDDEGRCIEDRRLIRAAVFPLDDHTLDDIGSMITALAERGLVVRYGHDGQRFLAVRNWTEHQKINRPTPSDLPGPDDLGSTVFAADAAFTDGAVKRHGALSEDSLRERKGKEGKGVQRAARSVSDHGAPRERRDAMWDALTAELGEACTATEKSNRGRTVTELLAADGTPTDVPARSAEYRRRMPGIALTDAALRKHWSSLAPRTHTPREGFDEDGNYFDPDTGAVIASHTVKANTR